MDERDEKWMAGPEFLSPAAVNDDGDGRVTAARCVNVALISGLVSHGTVQSSFYLHENNFGRADSASISIQRGFKRDMSAHDVDNN